jgi:hypothetical protein
MSWIHTTNITSVQKLFSKNLPLCWFLVCFPGEDFGEAILENAEVHTSVMP